MRSDNARRVYEVSSVQMHDLKNRLTVIKGLAQLLSRQIDRSDWQRDRIARRVGVLQDEIGGLEILIEGLRSGPTDEPAVQSMPAPPNDR